MKKIIKVEGKETKNSAEAINSLASTLGKIFVCDRCGQEKRIILSALQGDLSDLKQLNVCQDCLNLKELESFIGKEGIKKMIEMWSNKLQKLELNPLSIAKSFYEKWKVSDPVIMQRLIYFAYLEILKEKDVVLFEEKFQAWPGGPVLESVIYPMYEHCEDLKSFFSKLKTIGNSLVTQYLDKTAKKYLNLNSSQTYREARNKLWADALNEEKDTNPIDENGLFAFVQESRKQSLSLA